MQETVIEAQSTSISRWPIAVAGVAMQMILGTVYAWSVFKRPLMDAHGWTNAEVGLTFTLVILFLGLAAAFGGAFVDRAGARKVATIAAILFALATILAGVADKLGSKWLLWIGYGGIGGIGNGLGYITPIAVLVRWFPDKRGVITGTAVMGFGFGAAIMGQVAPLMIENPRIGLDSTFYFCGALFLIVALLAAQKLNNPPEGWTPPAAIQAKAPAASGPPMGLKGALGTYQFYLLWTVLFINITAGIALISNHSPMAQYQTGIVAAVAGTVIFAGQLFNGLGRIGWASLSDKLGRKTVFALLLGTQVPLLLWLPHIHNVWLFAVIGCYILACYGGGFATMPAYAADTFGAKNIGGIYGKILLAWSAAGVVGPMLMEFLSKADPVTNQRHFAKAFYVASGMLAIGFVLNLFYRRPAGGPGRAATAE